MEYRRFGKTDLQIPVLSCGGMRYQQSWNDKDPVTDESQENLEACIRRAIEVGVNHIETARGYGTSEEQLGRILPTLPREDIIVQTKVPPFDSVEKFEKVFEKSMRLLKLDYVDLFALHGINSEEEWEWAQQCFDTAERWRREGRIRNIGFSTHGSTALITQAIESNRFDYVNLHWYYIFQENWPCIEAATARDMGVFIISPNDKGGLLYKPSDKLRELCAPLDPMVFNGLFCLSHPEVHTLSCGVAKPEDFDIHLEMVARLPEARAHIAPVIQRLEGAMEDRLGREWLATWRDGLPQWQDVPDQVNIHMILHLRNLALAFDMIEYGKMRYNLLGNGGTWFPGKQATALETLDLSACLAASPHRDVIPGNLAEAHGLLAGEAKKRMQAS